ncbi:MAG: molybdopterin-binding protein [Lachnospiraceae bacterium]|nr:molybdopterin-binding protein [Lachnospiraceae bacterium]
MKYISTKDAIGHVLCHDITQIIPGEKKGPVFKKGHIITKEDVPVLLSVGKENIYVWEKKEGILHEDEAAFILKDIIMGASPNMEFFGPSEGKIEIRAKADGLLKIRSEALRTVNSIEDIMIATRHGNTPVKAGDKLAGTRVIPLVIEEEKLKLAKEAAGNGPLLEVLPFKKVRYGIITTGSEVAKGLIKDAFGPILKAKMSEYEADLIGQTILSDDKEEIVRAISGYMEKDADLILISGGMSVDPDDRTPSAIRESGAKIVSYGAPVLPGAMFMLSYMETLEKSVPVLGLPGCVMFAKRTIFDLVLPRILAGERLSREDITDYGEGGLCLSCDTCHYPICGFGK